jgi:hypothetical protein
MMNYIEINKKGISKNFIRASYIKRLINLAEV